MFDVQPGKTRHLKLLLPQERGTPQIQFGEKLNALPTKQPKIWNYKTNSVIIYKN